MFDPGYNLTPPLYLAYLYLTLSFTKDLSKSPKSMKKLLPKRKPERKPSEEEFALRKSESVRLIILRENCTLWRHICNPSCNTGTVALEEDAQILKVIEAYCTSAKTRQTLNSSKITQKLTHTLLLVLFYLFGYCDYSL